MVQSTKKYSLGLIMVLCLTLFLVGCDSGPIGSLQSNKPSKKYDYTYWAKQYRAKSEIWKKAENYCYNEQEIETQNCILVKTAYLLKGMLPGENKPIKF